MISIFTTPHREVLLHDAIFKWPVEVHAIPKAEHSEWKIKTTSANLYSIINPTEYTQHSSVRPRWVTYGFGTTVALLPHLHIAIPALRGLEELGRDGVVQLEGLNQTVTESRVDVKDLPVLHAPSLACWRGRNLRPWAGIPCSRWCYIWRTCGGAAPW